MWSEGNHDKQMMHSNSYNTEIMIFNQINEIINELFESLLSRYQIGLETLMKSSKFFWLCRWIAL